MDVSKLFQKWEDFKAEFREMKDVDTAYKPFCRADFGMVVASIDPSGTESIYVQISDECFDDFDDPSIIGISFEKGIFPEISETTKYVRISLTDNRNLIEAFESFSVTLVSRLWSAKTSEEAVDLIYEVCDDYQSLFRHNGAALSDREERGLMGEMIVLSEILDRFGERALDCWTGSEKNKHDFIFKGNDSIEVKTTTTQTRLDLKISNENQLSQTNGGKLFLKAFVLEKNPDGFTLGSIVEQIMNELLFSEKKKEQFRRKLLLAKYVVGKTVTSKKYCIIDEFSYSIDEKFPKLSHGYIQSISTRIFNVKYTINLDGLEKYQGDIYDAVGIE